MADIFISYASEDRNRVIPVVKALERHGWSVWWDRIIPPGKTFAKVIEKALGAARCLIVLWTAASVKSDWVSNEAAEGCQTGDIDPGAARRRRDSIRIQTHSSGQPDRLARALRSRLFSWFRYQ